MTHRPSREHRIPVLAVALLAILPIYAARAQSRPDSVQVDSIRADSTPAHPVHADSAPAPLVHAAAESLVVSAAHRVTASTIGASIATIDSAEIAGSGVRTLSELLEARVPGLSVRRRGGTEAEGSEVRLRGMTSPVGATPMLVIDGILVDAVQALPVPGTTVTMSRLDDLTPADVRRIEVLPGAAAAALYGPGAAAGVIAVTTKRGGAGPLRLDVSAGAGLTDLGTAFPANYQLTNGTPHQPCNPRFGQAGCTPTTLYSWNPLEQASPFRVGRTTSGRAAISGTSFGTQLYAGVAAERAGGVTSDDWQSRLGLRASVDRALPGHVTVSARGSYLERGASVPARGNTMAMDNVILRGLLGPAYDDSTHGYRMPYGYAASLGTRTPEPSLARVTSSLRLEWQPEEWLTIDALGGQDRARQSGGLSAIRYTRDPYDTVASYHTNGDQWTSGTLHLGMEGRYAPGDRLSFATYLAYDDVRTRDQTMDSAGTNYTNGLFSSAWMHGFVRQRYQQATVRQHVRWGEVFDVNVGTRWDVGRGVTAPLGFLASRNIDASFRLPEFRPGLGLRVRAAAGYVPIIDPSVSVSVPTYPFGPVGVGAVRARQGEREAGIDATIGQRTRLSLTYFSATARSTYVGEAMLYSYGVFGGYASWPLFADVTNRGLEALASTQWLAGPSVGWRTTLTMTTLQNRVAATDGLNPYSTNGSLATGYPVQGYWNTGYRWADANADGVISYDEVHPDSTRSYIGPSMPTVEIGIRNSVTLPHGLTFGALLDYRGGYYLDNQTEAIRCSPPYRLCRGLQDPSLSLADQAHWMAVSMGITHDIEPASFLRLREIVLEWTAPAVAARAIGAEQLTARLAGQNLATWTRYKGLDPEVGGSTSLDAWNAPADRFQQPQARRVLVEVRVGTGFGAP